MKKEPRQVRSRATVQAMVEACARILEERGYAGLTTNAVAEVAGVSIGSVYEFFPGKEAIVARLADTLLADVSATLNARFERTDSREDLHRAMRHLIGALHDLISQHRKLLQVLIFQVPFVQQLPSAQKLQQELLRVVVNGLSKSREHYRLTVPPSSLYLMATSTAGSLLHLVLMKPAGLDAGTVLDDLANKMADWLASG
ncbi:MAG: TetR/AcrR family transcriptional regulator [Pseudomonadota bacterium]|uniref:TetR/AcrR family transcriptional regulator n=1 Tax=Alcanivorax sp. TaxID=1872427 RepID=UPI0025C479AC|nr:TetR/AcrR family transcriptional regulator [Alcanivorax sp.]MED5238184.1 TetR/AcrR family transcriptional regulator [Pseudomonadota bacterium]MEE3320952.1 TetR/AcrR family transcriptional regulator [Pseudomonadota bacterium]